MTQIAAPAAGIALRPDPRALPRNPAFAPDLPRTVTVTFDDNALLPLLYGEHDRHLARIEQRLGVRIASRGNRATISGGAEVEYRARMTFKGLAAMVSPLLKPFLRRLADDTEQRLRATLEARAAA